MNMQVLAACLVLSAELILTESSTAKQAGENHEHLSKIASGRVWESVPSCVLPARLSNHEGHLLDGGPVACVMNFPGAANRLTPDNVNTLFKIYTSETDLRFESFPLQNHRSAKGEGKVFPTLLRTGHSSFRTSSIRFVGGCEAVPRIPS